LFKQRSKRIKNITQSNTRKRGASQTQGDGGVRGKKKKKEKKKSITTNLKHGNVGAEEAEEASKSHNDGGASAARRRGKTRRRRRRRRRGRAGIGTSPQPDHQNDQHNDQNSDQSASALDDITDQRGQSDTQKVSFVFLFFRF
jgi:hypothetical protein